MTPKHDELGVLKLMMRLWPLLPRVVTGTELDAQITSLALDGPMSWSRRFRKAAWF
jgi:hypothetical protein